MLLKKGNIHNKSPGMSLGYIVYYHHGQSQDVMKCYHNRLQQHEIPYAGNYHMTVDQKIII